MTGWVAIQRNPTSGSGRKRAVLFELIRGIKAHGLRCRLFSKRDRLDELLHDPQRRAELICVVAAGGDGTVDDVINRFPGVPVAVCPLGTENLFAKHLGVPVCGRFVAEMIAAGKTVRFDLCTLHEQRFLIMASFGFDADVVHRTHARRSGHIRKLSYVRPILESLWRYHYPPLRIYPDDAEQPLTGALAVVSNLPRYALRLPIAENAVANDGLLDVRIFERPNRFHMLRYSWRVWWGRHESLSDVRSLRAKSLRIEADMPIPVQADGDPAGFTPAEIRVLPGALTAFIP